MANLIIKPTSGGSLILQDEGGDAAVTVGTTGSTTLAGTANNLGTVTAGTIASGVTGGTGLQGITHASQWFMTTNFAGDAAPIVNNLEERDDPPSFGILGASMTVSSGIFTFPVTGYWLIAYNYSGYDTNATQAIQPHIQTTQNNSSYAVASQAQQGQYDASSTVYFGATCQTIFDVTSTANCKCRFHIISTDGGTQTMGAGDLMRTGFTFIRLGAT